MTSSTKPEVHVHTLSLRRQRRTEPRTLATCIKISEDLACSSGDMLVERQTDRQTRTSLSYWGRVINVYMYVHSAVQQVCRCFHSHSAAEGCRTDSLQHIPNSRRHWTRLLEVASVTAEHLELRSAWINVPAITCCSSSQMKWTIGQLQNTAILKKTNVKQVIIKSLKVIINFIPVSLSMYI